MSARCGDGNLKRGYRTTEGLVVSNCICGSSAAGAVFSAKIVRGRERSSCKPDTRNCHVGMSARHVTLIVLQGELRDVPNKIIQTPAQTKLSTAGCSIRNVRKPFAADGMASPFELCT